MNVLSKNIIEGDRVKIVKKSQNNITRGLHGSCNGFIGCSGEVIFKNSDGTAFIVRLDCFPEGMRDWGFGITQLEKII